MNRGDWFQTYTGRKFYPLTPSIEDIDPLDIAHALSLICRYGGHSKVFYSVAEHCVLLSYAVHPDYALRALLHDAAEAYVGDMVRPLKRLDVMDGYCDLEASILDMIFARFGLSPGIPDDVQIADARILHDERAAIMWSGHEWESISHLAPLGVRIERWTPFHAEAMYLKRLHELSKVDG